MNVDITLHKNSENCLIDYDSIKWIRVNEYLWYGNFLLKSGKYIDAEIADNYTNTISVHCTPIIWTKDTLDDFVELKEIDYRNYINHKDYWYTEIEFVLPDEMYAQSYTITPLKGEYEIWVVATTFEEYVEIKSKQENLQINITEITIKDDDNGN
jgi:hypothetical protein